MHVWRIPLDDDARVESYRSLLSDEERRRAARFVRDLHRRRFIAAHGALRSILAGYVGTEPAALHFVSGEHGKPALRDPTGRPPVEFNLSHSDDLALVAVARAHAVGVDLERWSGGRGASGARRAVLLPGRTGALRALAHAPISIEAGFFAAWTRKEAYLKATGHGITRGLHHFDVALAPGDPARLIADRLDDDADGALGDVRARSGAALFGRAGGRLTGRRGAAVHRVIAVTMTPPFNRSSWHGVCLSEHLSAPARRPVHSTRHQLFER